jgi:hypothetical protein
MRDPDLILIVVFLLNKDLTEPDLQKYIYIFYPYSMGNTFVLHLRRRRQKTRPLVDAGRTMNVVSWVDSRRLSVTGERMRVLPRRGADRRRAGHKRPGRRHNCLSVAPLAVERR